MANYHFSILLILESFCKMKAIHSKGGEGMNQVGLVGYEKLYICTLILILMYKVVI